MCEEHRRDGNSAYSGNFAQSANTINGWLRDFQWAQAAQVIQSYIALSLWPPVLGRSLCLGL